jgi:hypothetical protein
MAVDDAGARLEFDCAQGVIEEALNLDDQGRFEAKGRFIREHGGPVRKGEVEDSRPADYKGAFDGKTLSLDIVLEGGESLGTFRLTKGGRARLVKCR